MRASNLGFPSKFAIPSVALLLIALWLALHGYHGLTGDGQIYAFQAFARLHPQLKADLYLHNTSQDEFTLFSPVYAWCIDWLGLENGSRLLTLLFTLWLLAATWSLARAFTDRATAWLAVAVLLIISGDYGGSGVFQVLEPFLTARLPAEAMTITALSCYVRGMRRLAVLLAVVALFIHPLMALPGLLLIVCLLLPLRVSIGGAFAALAMAVVAIKTPMLSHVLTVMDSSWLAVVRERSQFLFLQLWSNHDWEINAQPFLYLGFTAIAVSDDRILKVCAVTALVGGAGLVLALIGSLVSPIAILVQGQGWRWVWICVYVSAMLTPFTILQVWRDEFCGRLCALLLVCGWILPGVGGTICVSLALIFWSTRDCFSVRLVTHVRWASTALGVAIVMWIFVKCWAVAPPRALPWGRAPFVAAQVPDFFGMKIPAMLVCALVAWGARTRQKTWAPMVLTALLATFSLLIFPAAFRQGRTLGAASEIQEFGDWENVIAPTDTVLVAPPRDVGAFVWFTLVRPNYLSLNQSSGVIFSRTTSLEVQRRSEVLLPLMDPDWKIQTGLAESHGGPRKEAATHRLTPGKLIAVCTDPELGFVISPSNVGFDPLRHTHAGTWKDWYLYDCRKVR